MNRIMQISLSLYSVCILVIVGLLNNHVSQPGGSPDIPENLTSDVYATLGIEQNKGTLLLVLNPQCPCSEATAENLLPILPSDDSQIQVRIVGVFEIPTKMQVFDRSMLPPSSFVTDWDGSLAGKLGINTSGHVLLYNKAGQLTFSGGITAGRGHRGDCLTRQLLANQLAGLDAKNEVRHFPVWGCNLRVAASRTESRPR